MPFYSLAEIKPLNQKGEDDKDDQLRTDGLLLTDRKLRITEEVYNSQESLKTVFQKHEKNNHRDTLYASPYLLNRVNRFFFSNKNPHCPKEEPVWRRIMYILTRAPVIALFTGFIVGFISVVKDWIFDKTNAVVVK